MELPRSFRLPSLFLLLIALVSSAEAGFVVVVISRALAQVGLEAAAAAVAGSAIASSVGVTASAVWYGGYVIVNGALYAASNAIGGVAVGAAVGGAAGGAAGAAQKSTGSVDTKSLSAITGASASEILASIGSVESVASAASATPKPTPTLRSYDFAKASRSIKSDQQRRSSEAMASISKWLLSGTVPLTWVPPTGTAAVNTKNLPTGTIGTVPGKPVKTLPPDKRPPEVPPGVPEFNFRMCQYDIIKMGEAKKTFVVENPKNGKNLRVNNIPATCMALSAVLVGNPKLGPHPFAAGSASLEWANVKPEFIQMVRLALGMPLLDGS